MRRVLIEKIRFWVRLALHTQDSPQRTALAFALGVFIAFLPPVPWVHTLLALLLAFVFRLNRLATLIGTYVNSPLTVFPLLALEMSLGLSIVGGKSPPEMTWRQFRHLQGWKDAFHELRPFLGPLMMGCILLGLVGATIAYFVGLKIIYAYRHRLAQKAMQAQSELELASPIPTPPGERAPRPTPHVLAARGAPVPDTENHS